MPYAECILLVDLDVRAAQPPQKAPHLILDQRAIALEGAAEFSETIHHMLMRGLMPAKVGISATLHQQLFVAEMAQGQVCDFIEALPQLRKGLQLIQSLIVGGHRSKQLLVLHVHYGMANGQGGRPN